MLALPCRTYMLRFCLAFSMSFLISGVMLNRSFLGMGRGTMGDRTSSGFFLHGTLGAQAHAVPQRLSVSLGLGWSRWIPEAGGAAQGHSNLLFWKLPLLQLPRC